ncbi:protein MKS1-like [Tasmannia lanceolata]|uniref:protein MKS1-like n=1 Tax=Tasmannia lanceolata TaxID=3420 RepID=UPI004063DF7C
MDPSEFPTGKPPRRELQGPRPAPLRVRKDSYKIKKPPVVPGQPSQPPSQPPFPPPQHRPPVIIYTVSPKVIHTDVSEFMTLVQRLTGSTSSSSSSSYVGSSTGSLSPAAQFATIEKAKASESERVSIDNMDIMDQLDIHMNLDRPIGSFPGILSPVPSSLPPISPNFFSPSVDPNSFSFLHDLSPIFQGNKSYIDNNFMSSPTALFSSTPIPSPSTFEFFNQFFDL